MKKIPNPPPASKAKLEKAYSALGKIDKRRDYVLYYFKNGIRFKVNENIQRY